MPRLDFGRDEWKKLYPFHPTTIALLEQVAARYGSRTRSAAVFCAQSVDVQSDASQRVLTNTLFDHFEPELERHPDLKTLQTVWRNWLQNESEIARDADEAATMRALMKTLILWKIAGGAPSVTQLANAIALDARLPGDGNYEYCQILLEAMRTRGSGLAVNRREGEFSDRYSIDIGARVGEMARRYTQNALHTLPPQDRRITTYVIQCCRDEALPLATLQNSIAISVMWRHVPRNVRLAICHAMPVLETLTNQLAMLGEAGQVDDMLLFIAPPFHETRNELWGETWRENARQAAQTLRESRWRGALMWWVPRDASSDEWQQARESTAQHLLLSDPQLQDNRRGRAVLEYLKNGLSEREAALSRIATRLLFEGTVATASGTAVDACDLNAAQNWNTTLESLVEFALPSVFPRFAAVAPRLRVLTPSNADALCLEILRKPADKPFFSASIERVARAIGEPLGLAKEDAGRWKMSALREDLAQVISALADEGIALSVLEAQLRKSEWGLSTEQTRVALCALLRSGEITATDARGNALTPTEIGMPLRRSVHALQRGHLIENDLWQRLKKLSLLLGIDAPHEKTFATQQQMRSDLIAWRDDARIETELAQARLHQLQRAWSHARKLWPQSEATLAVVAPLLQALDTDGSTVEFLARVAQYETEKLEDSITRWHSLLQVLEERHARLLAARSFLNHGLLAPPDDLRDERLQLLQSFEEGEAVLANDDILPRFETWRNRYENAYRDWHAKQNDALRWAAYGRILASDDVRVLQKLSTLQTRDFPFASQLKEAVDAELSRRCGRDGSLHGEPVCAACRLRFGERIALRDPRELEAMIQNGITTFYQALQEDSVREALSRRLPQSQLLQANGDGTALLSLLSEDVISAFDEAFRPRRCVTRSWKQLQNDVTNCRTRGEWQNVMLQWLDANEHLAEDDEIELRD